MLALRSLGGPFGSMDQPLSQTHFFQNFQALPPSYEALLSYRFFICVFDDNIATVLHWSFKVLIAVHLKALFIFLAMMSVLKSILYRRNVCEKYTGRQYFCPFIYKNCHYVEDPHTKSENLALFAIIES